MASGTPPTLPKTVAVPRIPQTSGDVEASRLLARQAARAARPAPPKSGPSNGANIGGTKVSGGARTRGGRA